MTATRVMLTTCYVKHNSEVSSVVREGDVTDTLESAYYRVMVPGTLVLADIFEMEGEPTLDEATIEAVRRKEARARLDLNLALSYHWNGDMLRLVEEGGILLNDKPAPITADQYTPVLEQLAQHPHYRHQHIVVVTSDGRTLWMTDGEIEVAA